MQLTYLLVTIFLSSAAFERDEEMYDLLKFVANDMFESTISTDA